MKVNHGNVLILIGIIMGVISGMTVVDLPTLLWLHLWLIGIFTLVCGLEFHSIDKNEAIKRRIKRRIAEIEKELDEMEKREAEEQKKREQEESGSGDQAKGP